MKSKIFYILIISFIIALNIPLSANGNTNTREYCRQLRDSSRQEYLQGNYVKCIEINTQILALAEKNNWKDYQATSLNSLGSYFLLISDYWQSLEYLLTAYEIALDIQDRELEVKILNNIGLLYYYTKEYTESIEYLKKAYSVSMNIKDSLMGARIAGNIGEIYVFLNNLDSAEHYIEIGLEKAKNLSDKSILYGISAQKALHLSLLGKEEEAIDLSLQLLETINNTDNNKEEFTEIMILLHLSQIYLKKGDNKEAIYYARQALRSQPTLLQTIEIYELLSDLYEEENVLDVANQYKDSAFLMQDSLLKINMNNYSEGSRAKFELFEMEKALVENKAKQKSERILFISILIFMVILTVVVVWIFRIGSIKNKQSKLIAELRLKEEENKKLLLEQQLKEQEALTLLEEERLLNEVNEKLILKQRIKEEEMRRILEEERLNQKIESKNKQLTARALSHSDRDELLKEIIPVLSDMAGRVEDPSLDLIIRKLKLQLKNTAQWDTFLAQAEQINPNLFYLLKDDYLQLTTNDIHFLSYIYLNLDTKKIAYLLDISYDACRKKKQRLAAKLGIKVEDLYPFLVNKIKYSSR